MTKRSLRSLVLAGCLTLWCLALRGGDLATPGGGSAPVTAPAGGVQTIGTNAADGLLLQFRNAPLNLVLDYLSDAAGFVINNQADLKGTVDVVSKDPVSKAEAVELLNAALRKNGYAVVRESAHGRILTIVSLDTAKTSDLEINQGSDPNAVEKSAEVVTQIIPVRYANATQLMNNLLVLLPTSATLSVNESANTLILVAPKTDVRRMLKIVSALDSSIASISSIKVFPLRYADAKQLATVIQQLFSSQGSGQGADGVNGRAQLFNFPGSGPLGPFGNLGGGANSAGSSSGAANALKLSAAADEVSNSLIVSASTGLLETIGGMVKQIDRPVADVTELRAFHLANADPTELADQLAQLFPDSNQTRNDQSQGVVRFGGGPGGIAVAGPGGFGGGFPGGFGGGPGFGAGNTRSDASERAKKQSRVLAVADARTSSLLVSAPGTLMPEIARMISELDASPAKREVVKVFELQNASAHDVNQILQDLFNRNNTARTTSNNRNSLVGDNDPLATRETQQQQNNTASGTLRTGGAGGAGGSGASGTQGF